MSYLCVNYTHAKLYKHKKLIYKQNHS